MMKTLETERLILRKFEETDFAAVHEYACCTENIIYMQWGPNTEEQTRGFIYQAMKNENTYNFAVVIKSSGRLIGGCELSVDGDSASVGWCLHRDFWKRGFGTELGFALLKFGFEDLKLHRITAQCDAENIGSYRVMEKIGMRREGYYIENRPPNKLTEKAHSDGLSYAILKDEWETECDIPYFKSLSLEFNGFADIPELYDGVIRLVCTAKKDAVPEKKLCPSYDFAVCLGSEKIGEINLRVGYSGFGPNESSLFYGGQIGYNINEKYRGNGYAVRACRLLLPVARAHKMPVLLITNNVTNTASKRVCEKLGARLIRVARLPEWIDLYKEGQRFLNIFEWKTEEESGE